MIRKTLKSYAVITAGSVLFALAFDWFFAPNQVAMGGVTGAAQVIHVLAPVLPVGLLTIALNVPLFLAGWRLLGFHLLASSLFSMAVSSAAICPTRKQGIYDPSARRGKIETPMPAKAGGSLPNNCAASPPSCWTWAKTASLCRNPSAPGAVGSSFFSILTAGRPSAHLSLSNSAVEVV